MNLKTETRRKVPWVGYLVAIALITAVFYPALSGSFIFDDYPIFIDNGVFHTDHWDWAALQNIWSWSQANIHRPLAMVSYALNYAFGGSIFGFKATNLAIHLVNTVLLTALATRLLRACWPADNGDAAAHERRTAAWAMVLATAWALHPLQVSTVMYVVQRMELLGFIFTLLALLAYWRARQLQMQGLQAWPWLLAVLASIGVGYMAKETIVLVPGYALLLELTVLRFGASRSATQRAWKWFYAVGSVAAVAVVVFYLIPHYMMNPGAFANRTYTAGERELTQLRVLPMYIGWSILPIPTQLHFYYDNYLVSTGWLHPASTLLGGMFLLALLGLAVVARRRRPLFALGIAWFFVAHLITSAPLSLELVFEHRNYPSLFGILLAVVDLIWWATRSAHPRLPAILGTVFIVSLGFFTVLRAATWGNPLQLALTLAHDNPTSPRASYDLARLYMDMSQSDPDSPLFGRSIRELERGAALPTSSPLPEQALLLTAAAQGMPPQQEWWDSLLHKLETRPLGSQERRALQGLATQAINGEAKLDPERLDDAYQTVLRRVPRSVPFHTQYADVASTVLHNTPLAIQQWLTALELSKDKSDFATRMLGYLLANQRVEEAAALATKAEQLQPGLSNDAVWQGLREQLLREQKIRQGPDQ